MLLYVYRYFCDIFFVVLYKIIYVFIIFIYFYDKYQFPQQNINQSETGTDDKKLSVELYA